MRIIGEFEMRPLERHRAISQHVLPNQQIRRRAVRDPRVEVRQRLDRVGAHAPGDVVHARDLKVAEPVVGCVLPAVNIADARVHLPRVQRDDGLVREALVEDVFAAEVTEGGHVEAHAAIEASVIGETCEFVG